VTERAYAHFIGIGGAGMSAIARVLHERGIAVTGSDLKETRYARALMDMGVPVTIGHDAEALGNPEVVVVSSAIPKRNPELVEAVRRGIPVWPRARMLAHLAEDRSTIAIAGTHGKTSTCAMTATMLARMGESPTFLVGGELVEFGTNASCGQGTYYVVEADESDGSFVYLDPDIAVVTNIEAEHLDHYGTLDMVERTFVEFMSKVSAEGTLVLCADDTRLLELAKDMRARVVTYGSSEAADLRFEITEPNGTGHGFTVRGPDGIRASGSIPVPGEHMVSNATAAIAVAYAMGRDVQSAAQAVSSFQGVRRRFEKVGEATGVAVVDDYAHHPTEIRATLSAARAAGFQRIWVVFQPHRFTRTESLAAEFGGAFTHADRVVVMDVYSAGETPIPGVSGKTVVDTLLDVAPRTRVAYLPHRADVAPFLAKGVRPGDLIMTMGAGDVTAMGPEILRELEVGRGGA